MVGNGKMLNFADDSTRFTVVNRDSVASYLHSVSYVFIQTFDFFNSSLFAITPNKHIYYGS